jgi:dihydrolipoamide dehydrogenase
VEYYAVPNCIFTNPEVAAVGVSERNAQESGIDYRVGKFPFVASGKAVAMGAPEGFVKIIADGAGRVIGGQVVGAHASDLIAEIALAVSRRLKLEDISETIHAHPTLAESTAEAVEATVGQAIHI